MSINSIKLGFPSTIECESLYAVIFGPYGGARYDSRLGSGVNKAQIGYLGGLNFFITCDPDFEGGHSVSP